MFLAYRFLTTLIFPFLVVVIFFRKLIKKEDAKRYKEKILLKKIDYNFEKPVWFHGASIGEIKSIVPIIKYLTNKYSKMKILITSVTLSSGKIIEKEFKDFENIHHQYFPLDVPFLAKKFLKSWKPKLVVFIDSEIWPNFLFEIKKRNINLILLNARITKKTFLRWKFLRKFSTELFSSFNICLAASKESYHNLLGLRATNVKFIGNLKYFSDKGNKIITNKKLSDQFNNYKVWCAASTHKGEDEICIQAHKEIKKIYNNVLTIIIPRHIERINDIYTLCKNHNLQTQILTGEDILEKKVEIILINTFGDLLKYYNYCNSVFIGKSLIASFKSVGGQNPIEAAHQGCKIYHGPYIYNFKEVYNYLQEAKISRSINNSKELSENIIKDFKAIKNKDFNEIKKLNLYGKNIFQKTMIELEKYIQR
jgi:3-deoxy-D-manno-octulosonic-acid transferase